MTSQTETVRGNERIQQLTEMFPEMSRQKVVSTELMIEGCKNTPALREVGRWALPDAHDHYDYDFEEHNDEDLVDGVARIPKYIYLNGTHFYLMLDSQSPYEVRYEGGGRYWLYRDGDPIEETYFAPCPQWFWKKTSSGRSMNSIVFTRRDEWSFGLYVTTYCEYFKDDIQCRFCNLNPTLERYAKLRGDRNPVKQEQDVYESFLAFAQEMGVDSISLGSGGFYDRKKEADTHLRNIDVLKRAMRDSGHHTEKIGILSQAIEAEDQIRWKEAGVTSVSWHQEVWDPRLFEIICPGKAKYVGREHWMELMFKAVDVFGRGKVSNSFIVGAETSPPYGDKSEAEEFESIVEGIRCMASHGVSTFLAALEGRWGSKLERAQRPRIEHFLRIDRECNKAAKDCNLGAHSMLDNPRRLKTGAVT